MFSKALASRRNGNGKYQTFDVDKRSQRRHATVEVIRKQKRHETHDRFRRQHREHMQPWAKDQTLVLSEEIIKTTVAKLQVPQTSLTAMELLSKWSSVPTRTLASRLCVHDVPALIVARVEAGENSSAFLFEAAWFLCNIVATNPTLAIHVLRSGILRIIVPLLTHVEESLTVQAMWVLCNLTNNSEVTRNAVLRSNCDARVLELARSGDDEMAELCTWFMCGVTTFRPLPKNQHLQHAIDTIRTLLLRQTNSEVQARVTPSGRRHLNKQIMQCLANLTDNHCDKTATNVLVPDTLTLFTQRLDICPDAEHKALRFFINVTIDNHDTCLLMVQSMPFLSCMHLLLESPNVETRRFVVHLLANLTGDSKDAVIALQLSGLISKACAVYPREDITVQQEYAWFIANLLTRGSDEFVFGDLLPSDAFTTFTTSIRVGMPNDIVGLVLDTLIRLARRTYNTIDLYTRLEETRCIEYLRNVMEKDLDNDMAQVKIATLLKTLLRK